MDFWERLDAAISHENTNRKSVAKELGFAVGNFASWKTRRNYPTADVAVRIACYLHTTVEELVDGDEGAVYVRTIMEKRGGVWRPPDKLREIVDDLEVLNDSEIASARLALRGFVDVARNRVADSNKNGQADAS